MNAEPCPTNDFLCPYFENGDCRIDGGNPHEECDAFFGLDEDE